MVALQPHVGSLLPPGAGRALPGPSLGLLGSTQGAQPGLGQHLYVLRTA